MRTNCRLEAYHRVLNFTVAVPHTGFYTLVRFLFDEAIQNRFLVQNLVDGVPVRTPYESLFKDFQYKDLWDKLDAKQILPGNFLYCAANKVEVNPHFAMDSRVHLDPDE